MKFSASAAMMGAAIAIGFLLLGQAAAQQPDEAGKLPPLTLRTRIALPGVYGRIDHFGWDSKRGILLVSALGNDTVEIVDSWKRVRTITGLEHPQATLYVPGVDRIAVSSQSGRLRFYDAATYALIKTLDFGPAANTDNMRYDVAAKRIYVAYGEREHGALAAVDPVTMERLEEVRLGSHPESFQLEQNGTRIFVNLPDQEGMAVIDRKTAAVTKWKIPGNANAHALALDEARHRLFTASLQPGRLSVVDTETGSVTASLPCGLGVDDLWLDAVRNRLYAPGAGAVDIFQSDDTTRLTALAHVGVGAGAGSTSLHVRTRTQDSLYMASPNMLAHGGSEVLLFYVND